MSATKGLNKAPAGDTTKVWVFGKVQPGWYVARWMWNKEYAEYLVSLGYQVERSINSPGKSVAE